MNLRPGEASVPYAGNEPLASVTILGGVSVSGSAISGQVAANLEAPISAFTAALFVEEIRFVTAS